MAGGVIVLGVVAVTAVVSIVAAIVAAFMAMLSTLLVVLGVVAGVGVLGLVTPPIIRAVGDARAARTYAELVATRQLGAPQPEVHQADLETLRQRLLMLELRSAPMRKLED